MSGIHAGVDISGIWMGGLVTLRHEAPPNPIDPFVSQNAGPSQGVIEDVEVFWKKSLTFAQRWRVHSQNRAQLESKLAWDCDAIRCVHVPHHEIRSIDSARSQTTASLTTCELLRQSQR